MASASHSSVRLYVYDVTRGMARQMAPLLLGRPLDGVWHTGIMVYGNEYFYGGHGISYCPPGGTILGHPDEVIDLGETEIPLDMLHEYLVEMEKGRFRGDKYHLLDHNCNNFSNELAQFLTGKTIPDRIISLPADVMNTPLGQIIRPFIDAMMAEVSSGTHVNASAAPQPTQNASAPKPTAPAASQDSKPKPKPPDNKDLDLD